MLPSIFLFSLAPKDFVFGNIGYAKLNTLYRYDMGYERAMTLIGKIKYLLKDVLSEPGNLAVVITFFYLTVQWVSIALKKPRSLHFEVVYIFILLPFIFFGSFAPTPSWYQYFYAPMAFLIIGIFYIIYDLQNFDKIRKSNLWLIAIVLVFLFIYAIPKYKGIGNVINLEKWFPVKAHQQGVNISDVVSEGEVLTLASIFPLEGGLCIYNEFVMSPFAWRVAHILPENKRNELGLIGVGDLETFLADKCPDAILVGFESPITEEPLNTFAKKEGYDLIKLDGKILWIIEN